MSSRFNWWRRHKSKAKLQRKDALKGKSFLLQQIRHGDYDHSDYKRQAQDELRRCEVELQAFVSKYKGDKPTQEYKYLEIERSYRKRYNKLMEDYHWEEASILVNLKLALIKDFGVDIWDEVMEEALKQDIEDLESVYFLYNKMHQQLTQPVLK